MDTQSLIRAERARIARDLHDGVGAELHALLFVIGQEDGEELANRVRQTAESLRDVVWGLSAAEKPWDEWLADIRVRCRELCADTLRLAFVYDDLHGGAVDPRTQHALTRMLLEATRNAVRHSKGKSLRIVLRRDASGVSLDVTDDGRGFGGEKNLRSPRGLTNLRVRATELGGTCDIGDGDAGAHVHIRLPAAPSFS